MIMLINLHLIWNTSSVVKLYKKDKTKDYSNSGNSIVKVTYSY